MPVSQRDELRHRHRRRIRTRAPAALQADGVRQAVRIETYAQHRLTAKTDTIA
jgi:hypothetical protein